jgi:putative cardiolipin synthase
MRIKALFHFVCPVLLGLLTASCTVLKPPGPQPEVRSLAPAESGSVAKASRSFAKLRGADQSGFLLLDDAEEALKWRLALADEATTSIDIQYFIWKADETGSLLFHRLFEAADRGVKVRLLVDELNFTPDDKDISNICQHPNFEIKIFNPGYIRSSFAGALFEWATNFKEMNRRMHNKIFLVDGRMAILGGRNIGNEYFGLSEKYNFIDLDTLVIGEVVPELAQAFDEYWNSEPAYPGALMYAGQGPEDLARLRTQMGERMAEIAAEPLLAESPYPTQVRDWSREFAALPREMTPGDADFIQDTPESEGKHDPRLLDMLDYLAAPSHKELLLVSAYFIPVDDMLDTLTNLSNDGVNVRILTGGMTGTNHVPVSAHYKKYRKPILRGGMELTELHHLPAGEVRAVAEVPPYRGKFIAMHSKAIVGDRQRCFIGSLNLDPRAIVINTENGLLIESPQLAQELTEQFEAMMRPDSAWAVTLDEHGRITWQSDFGRTQIQPARSFSQRLAAFFFQLLPIESQL